MHIIINRIALIMYDGRRVRRLKWTVTGLIGAINIAVFIIWMPARLQINPTWIAINNVWDRVEKGLLALIDLGLNLKFIHLVHTELIKHGLTKYRDLYRFNITMIFVSLSLDVCLRRPLWVYRELANVADKAHRSSLLGSCRFLTSRALCTYQPPVFGISHRLPTLG